jgi:hypothetical protein
MSDLPTLDLSKVVDLSALMHKKAEDKAKQLPKPSGYRILCAIPEAEKQFEESEIGLMKADETMRNEETLTTVLFVVELGPEDLSWGQRFSNEDFMTVPVAFH